MHPTRAASLLAALGAALIAAALLLRALSLGQSLAQPAPAGQAQQFLPALGGYLVSSNGQAIHFIQAPPSAPRTLVSWYSMPVNGGMPASGTAPTQDLRPFRVSNGLAYVYAANGSSLLPGSPRDEQVLEARLSPDGKSLAIATKTERGKRRLYILHENARLEWLGEEDAIIDLDWSPDNTRLAFAAPRERVDQIFVAAAGGQQYRQITTDGARKSRPRWSPDSSAIAYLAVDGSYSSTIGLATPTAPPVILAPTLTPAAGSAPPIPSRVDVFITNADGSNQRRLTDTPEQEMSLAWLQSRRGAEVSFAARLVEHPQVAYLYAIPPEGGALRRVYPTVAVETIECPPRISANAPALARITVSNSALVQQDLPLVLRASELPFQPFEDIQAGAVHSETVTLMPGETRSLEWEVKPSGGRTTYLSVVANTMPRLPLSEQHCSAPNTYFDLPRLPFVALGLPLILLGMLLCLPRLLQVRRRWFWFIWGASLAGFWLLFVVEAALG